jgi:penicillin-binding protein 1A
MSALPPLTVRLRGSKLAGRLAFVALLILSIAGGIGAGLLFVYSSDLPEVRALETYRPNVITELYADDGQEIASFALQRRILLTFEQIPHLLQDAIIVTEDQHFFEHWGVDLPRVLQAAYLNLMQGRIQQGASTLTMQLAGGLFLDRTDRSFGRKIQETLLAIQIERSYTKPQIFTLYANQVYLAHGNYGMEAGAQFYFSKSAAQLTLPEAALLAGLIRGPGYSPLLNPQRALDRRNLVLSRMEQEGKITAEQFQQARAEPLALQIQVARNDLAPYFVEEIRKYLEATYGTQAVHENGLRVYTTLNVLMQRAANRAVSGGLHAYERRHGWRGALRNVSLKSPEELAAYQDPDWRAPIQRGDYLNALVLSAGARSATLRIGPYRSVLAPADFAWTGRAANELLRPGDIALVHIRELSGDTARVDLEQAPGPQAALVAIDNGSGEVKAMVGGYSFRDSKFNRATQAQRQVGSSFKVFTYAAALEQGFTPFDTVLDAPLTVMSGGEPYSPRNYDEKFEGMITLRRALAGSRNVPAVRLADRVGINSIIEMTRRFGITSPLPPYLPITLGAADLNLLEQTSAFTVFPDDGIRIDPHMIRRVTTYDGAVLEQTRPAIHDVIAPDVARTMVAMLADVVNFGTGMAARALERPAAGKTGTTNNYSDAWFMGFTPQLTTGVWVGYDDKRISLGTAETGSRTALPIWLEFMQGALVGLPVEGFAGVEPLEKQAATRQVHVDTPDTAPTEHSEESATPPTTEQQPADPVSRVPSIALPPAPQAAVVP